MAMAIGHALLGLSVMRELCCCQYVPYSLCRHSCLLDCLPWESADCVSVLSTCCFLATFLCPFAFCLIQSCVVPSLWPYLHSLGSDKAFLAWVVALYSVGEAVGAVLFGSLATFYSTRLVMIAATVAGAAGSMMYFVAEAYPGTWVGPWLVLLGRVLQGMWTGGSQAAQQTHLAKVLPAEELTSTTVMLNAYACLGFVFGPTFGLLASFLPTFTLPGVPSLHFNELTAPGYLVMLSTVVIIFLFAQYFGSGESLGPATQPLGTAAVDDEEEVTLLVNQPRLSSSRSNGHYGTHKTSRLSRPGSETAETEANNFSHGMSSTGLWTALVVCNIAFFTHFYGFALQETVTTYVFSDPNRASCDSRASRAVHCADRLVALEYL